MALFYPFSYLMPAHYNNLEKIARIRRPKLVIHGTEDEIVPFLMGRRLFEAAKEPKYFFAVNGASHNDTFVAGGDKYAETIRKFADDLQI